MSTNPAKPLSLTKKTKPKDPRTQDKQEDAYWSQLMDRVSKKEALILPLPRKVKKQNILDDVMGFFKQRDSRSPATFNTTVNMAYYSQVSNTGHRDVGTMTTFEPSFLQSFGNPVETKVMEDEVVPDSQEIIETPRKSVAGECSAEDGLEVNDFMPEALNRTQNRMESEVSVCDNTMDANDVGSTTVAVLEMLDSGNMKDNYGQSNRKVGGTPAYAPKRTSYFSSIMEETSMEVKSRPYIASLLGEPSKKTKTVHNILYNHFGERNPPSTEAASKAPDTFPEMVDKLLSGILSTKKRKKNIICGVNLSKHPEPMIVADLNMSQSQGPQQKSVSVENDDVVFTTPRPPKPVSPGSKRLRRQLGIIDPPAEKKAKRDLASSRKTPFPGSRKRPIDKDAE